MLKNLKISNYALIEKSDIDFSSGFSVITGETGAGKSIILGALGLLMGQRADSKVIKANEKKCAVEAVFNIEGLQLEAFFAEHDIDYDAEECILRREVSSNGKSRAFVNDSPVSASTLKLLAAEVIDIHSQHQNLLMGREHFLLDILDAVANNQEVKDAYAQCFHEWHEACKALKQLKEQRAQDQANRDFLQFQFDQLEAANLQADEQSELEEEHQLLSHAEEIKGSLFEALNAFSEDGGNIAGKLRSAAHDLSSISGVFAQAEALAARIESARIELEDVSEELERNAENIEFDPARYQFVEERLNTIYELEKKHQVDTIADLLRLQEELNLQLNNIENGDEIIAEKEKAIEGLYQRLLSLGKDITTSRKTAAKTTAENLMLTLQTLGMPNARLRFEITTRTAPDISGFDNVTFLFSANKNVPEQDVTQIASGGEIARLMLSLKAFLSQRKKLPTIIFDEIDTGVSGTMAERMAQVMQQMAQNCQVICITHLPQIAALGQQHYRVFKSENDTGTSSHITRLNNDERIREIANMLSGEELTEAAINNAKALLKNK